MSPCIHKSVFVNKYQDHKGYWKTFKYFKCDIRENIKCLDECCPSYYPSSSYQKSPFLVEETTSPKELEFILEEEMIL